jgi:hypothetical protein
MLSGEIANKIRQSYSGGAVDMFLSKPFNNKQIYAYDINSLYPFVMKNNKFPIGSPTYFIGDILKFNPQAFGFFYCRVLVSDNINHPILQARISPSHSTQSGYNSNDCKSIFPTGNWEGMYFSEELYNARKYGYKFEVLWGYTFEKGFVFKEYVEDLYNLRLNYPKTDPMNLIANLLLNSLYGRFGMDDSFTNTKIISKSDYLSFEDKHKEGIKDIIDLKDNYLVQYKDPKVEHNTLLNGERELTMLTLLLQVQ